jgi:hypothetical protein
MVAATKNAIYNCNLVILTIQKSVVTVTTSQPNHAEGGQFEDSAYLSHIVTFLTDGLILLYLICCKNY